MCALRSAWRVRQSRLPGGSDAARQPRDAWHCLLVRLKLHVKSMESEIRIQCATHGESEAAFVCQHLLGGERRGFNWAYGEEKPDAWCPDAWCDECEAGLELAGEWTEEMAERADIKMVC